MPGAGGSAAFFALTETAHCAGRRCEAPIFKSNGRQLASPLLHRAATPDQSGKRPASRTPARSGSMSAPEPEELKHCPGCSLQKPLSMFHKNRSKYALKPPTALCADTYTDSGCKTCIASLSAKGPSH